MKEREKRKERSPFGFPRLADLPSSGLRSTMDCPRDSGDDVSMSTRA